MRGDADPLAGVTNASSNIFHRCRIELAEREEAKLAALSCQLPVPSFFTMLQSSESSRGVHADPRETSSSSSSLPLSLPSSLSLSLTLSSSLSLTALPARPAAVLGLLPPRASTAGFCRGLPAGGRGRGLPAAGPLRELERQAFRCTDSAGGWPNLRSQYSHAYSRGDDATFCRLAARSPGSSKARRGGSAAAAIERGTGRPYGTRNATYGTGTWQRCWAALIAAAPFSSAARALRPPAGVARRPIPPTLLSTRAGGTGCRGRVGWAGLRYRETAASRVSSAAPCETSMRRLFLI